MEATNGLSYELIRATAIGFVLCFRVVSQVPQQSGVWSLFVGDGPSYPCVDRFHDPVMLVAGRDLSFDLLYLLGDAGGGLLWGSSSSLLKLKLLGSPGTKP